jgi:hypothetical protein
MIDDAVRGWCDANDAGGTLNTKCMQVFRDGLTAWRNVGKGMYDFRAGDEHNVVAVVRGATLEVKAVYRLAPERAPEFVAGERLPEYG